MHSTKIQYTEGTKSMAVGIRTKEEPKGNISRFISNHYLTLLRFIL